MTIVSTGEDWKIDQIEKHLNKKLDVIKVRRLDELDSVALEMMLIKVSYNQQNRAALLETCLATGAQIMVMTPKYMLIEIHNAPDMIENFIGLVKAYGILEIQRTGTIALSK